MSFSMYHDDNENTRQKILHDMHWSNFKHYTYTEVHLNLAFTQHGKYFGNHWILSLLYIYLY